jgi:hypothetical protein
VSPKRAETRELRNFTTDTLRLIGVNNSWFEIYVNCRRLVTTVVVGVRDAHWSNALPSDNTPLWAERLVVNVILPERAGGLRTPAWHPLDTHGTHDTTFIFRPTETRVDSGPAAPRIEPDLGALQNVAIATLDIGTSSKYTLVGLEDVSWDRIGVPKPAGQEARSKEAWFRARLEEMTVPVLGLQRAAVNVDDIQSRIEFLSHAQYRARVGREEYEGDLIPLEGLLDRFAVAA